MMMYSKLLLFLALIYSMNISSAQHPVAETQVYLLPKPDGPNQTNILPYVSIINSINVSVIFPKATPLSNSNCFCAYDQLINLYLCSPLLQNSTSYPLSSRNLSSINITLNDCTFFDNRLNLPIINNKTIDYLRLYDINHQDYLVFDSTSFGNYKINNLYIIYNSIQPITILLMSNGTFSLLSSSLRTLYIDSCYLLTLNRPLNCLYTLESMTLMNLQQFSWYDIQQQIISLPKLRSIYIGENINSVTQGIFNVLSCQDISTQWILSYRLIQTCSCKLLSFLKTIQRYETFYRCPYSQNSIDFRDDICQLNGKEYKIQNQSNLFCNQCLAMQCPKETACGETFDSPANCISLSSNDYDTIRNRIPVTPYTRPYLFRESQQYLNMNPNKTLEPTGFNSIATMLIDSNRNRTGNSPDDVQMFHQTFAELLNQPWSTDVYRPASSKPVIWQDLLMSLDESIKNINDNQARFEFQSKPISTISGPMPTYQQSSEIVGWQITNDNQIKENITRADLTNQNITSRVFMKLNNRTSNCLNSTNCTNRFSITSIKSQKLFYNTNRIPEYDVISILAPDSNHSVTFCFDHKLSSTDTVESSSNTTNSTTDSFYDQLDRMIPEGSCMFLNTTSLIWQTDGCYTDHQSSNSTSVVCTCEHLTMFTVFFSLTCETPSKTVVILSWIGCILSIIGLSITLIMFIVISRCRQIKNSNNGISSSHSSSSQELRRRIMNKPRRRLSMVKSMLFILCILLILMNIFIFILTFIKPGRNLACSILSALLYYFTLAAFLWKFLFAVQQSLFLTNIIQPYLSNRTLFIIYLIITFSLPLCPLLIMFIKYENFTFISSTCNYCWLTREFLLYGLIIPILVIVCLNFIFYFYTMIHLCIRNRQQPGLRSTKTEHSRYIQNFKIGLFFIIIMGLSWILGFLVLIPNSYVQFFGNILFCIVNTLQGFAFSIMAFCMLERKSFRKCLCFWRYKNHRKSALNSSNNNIPKQLVTTSNEDNNTKLKTSSVYISSTSNSDQTNQNGSHPYKNKQSSTKQEEEDGDEHIYSTLAL